MGERTTIPRGRHAPPLEVRVSVQRRRLFEAAAIVFARVGYAEAGAESISREAGMSKATFYEHFANKEDCILALFEEARTEVLRAIGQAAVDAGEDPRARLRAGIHAFLGVMSRFPEESQTLLVEIIGAGEAGIARRDSVLATFAQVIDFENATAARRGALPRFASPHDSFAIVGAIMELASRHVRLGVPAEAGELEPVIERMLVGLPTASGSV